MFKNGVRVWNSATYKAHRKQGIVDAHDGLNLHWRSLSPAQIARQYPAKKIERLLGVIERECPFETIENNYGF